MKKALSVFILLAVILSLLTVNAFAFSEKPDITRDFSVGELVLWHFSDSRYATDVSVIEGELPAGLICTRSLPFGSPIISGIPLKSGEFEVVVRIFTGITYKDYDILINVSDDEPWTPVLPTFAPDEPKEQKELEITKDPTGETVNAGDTAYFISRCDNAEGFKWIVSDPSGETEYAADEAAAHFPGLVIDGEDTDTLILENIPYSINGWRILCEFSGGKDKTLRSAAAMIRVNDPVPEAPAILSQPTGGSFTAGESAVLSVQASGAGDSLSYQWFSSPVNDVSSMSPIAGATSASFTVPQTVGTTYYSVGVTASKNGRTSAVKYSDPVEVTYAAATPAPVITPAPTAAPAAPESTPGGSASAPDTGHDAAEKTESRSSFLFLFVVAFVLLAGLILFLVIMSKRRTKVMRCPKCGCEVTEGTLQCPRCGERIL